MIYDFQGRPIRLPWKRWLHIIDPSGRHPYMAGMLSQLLETLGTPDIVRRSNSGPARVGLYYNWFDNIIKTRVDASGDIQGVLISDLRTFEHEILNQNIYPVKPGATAAQGEPP